MEEIKPTLNLNEEEKALIQSVFKENEALLQSVNALFLGLPVSDEEKTAIQGTFKSKALKDIMWRRFYPTVDRNSPIGQVQDLWLGVESMIFGQQESTIKQAIQYKQRSLAMTKHALELLNDPFAEQLNIDYDPNKDDVLGISLLARNQFIRHVASQLNILWTIACMKTETKKQVEERKALDSSQ